MGNNRFILEKLTKGDSPTYKSVGEFPTLAYVGFALKISRQSLDYKLKKGYEFIYKGVNYRILDKVGLYDARIIQDNPFKVINNLVSEGWVEIDDKFHHVTFTFDGEKTNTYVDGELKK